MTQNFDLFTELLAEQKGDLAAGLPGPRQAGGRGHRAQPRSGQPAAHLREHELDRQGAEPGRPDPQLHPHGPGARAPDPALRAVLAADGGGLRAGGLRHPLRQLHAPLPHGEDGRDPARARGLRGVQGLRPHARPCATAGVEALVEGHPRLRPATSARWRSGSEPDADAEAGLPRPARAEGGCGLPVPAGAVPRLRERRAQRSRLRCSGAAGRGLRVPPRHLRHPHQLDEQDLRHLRARRSRRTATSRASRRTSSRCPPIAASPATRSSAATCTPATSTTSAAAATGCAGWRTTAARSACRWTNTPSSTSCRRTRTSRRRGSRRSARSGSASSRQWLHTLGNLTLTGYNAEYSDRPFAEKRDMAGGFKREPAQAQRRARPARRVERRRDPGARRAARRSGARRCGPRRSSMPQRLAAYQPRRRRDRRLHHRDHPHLLRPGRCARCSRPSARRCSRSIPA